MRVICLSQVLLVRAVCTWCLDTSRSVRAMTKGTNSKRPTVAFTRAASTEDLREKNQGAVHLTVPITDKLQYARCPITFQQTNSIGDTLGSNESPELELTEAGRSSWRKWILSEINPKQVSQFFSEQSACEARFEWCCCWYATLERIDKENRRFQCESCCRATITGVHGNAVAAFFTYLRWCTLLNLTAAFLWIGFIIIPVQYFNTSCQIDDSVWSPGISKREWSAVEPGCPGWKVRDPRLYWRADYRRSMCRFFKKLTSVGAHEPLVLFYWRLHTCAA